MTWETWISGKVREARLEAGFASVEKLARAIGVSLNAAYRWEWAKTSPSSKHLALIALATHKPIEFFYPPLDSDLLAALAAQDDIPWPLDAHRPSSRCRIAS